MICHRSEWLKGSIWLFCEAWMGIYPVQTMQTMTQQKKKEKSQTLIFKEKKNSHIFCAAESVAHIADWFRGCKKVSSPSSNRVSDRWVEPSTFRLQTSKRLTSAWETSAEVKYPFKTFPFCSVPDLLNDNPELDRNLVQAPRMGSLCLVQSSLCFCSGRRTLVICTCH